MMYVLITLDQPFGADTFYHCFLQIEDNENSLNDLHDIFKEEDGFYFGKIFTSDEVDTFMEVFSSAHFVAFADNVGVYKISGEIILPERENENNEEYFEKICGGNIKFPDFIIGDTVIKLNDLMDDERDDFFE